MKRSQIEKIKSSIPSDNPEAVINSLLDWVSQLENILNDLRLAGFDHVKLLQTRDEMLRTLGDIWE